MKASSAILLILVALIAITKIGGIKYAEQRRDVQREQARLRDEGGRQANQRLQATMNEMLTEHESLTDKSAQPTNTSSSTETSAGISDYSRPENKATQAGQSESTIAANPRGQSDPMSIDSTLPLDAQIVVDSFRTYCVKSNADFDNAYSLAKASALQSLSEEYKQFVIAKNAARNEAFIIASDPATTSLIALGLSDPDSCVVLSIGVPEAITKEQIISEYGLEFAFGNDAGHIKLEAYVPGGISGTQAEALKRGLVTIRAATVLDGMHILQIGYVPPTTVAASLGNK